jgi:type IV fimbrial biogenesis protein FimT
MRNVKTSMQGFTLTELLMALAVLAILLAIATPSFRDASLSSQLRALANNLVASANVARSEAFKRNTPITMCTSTADGTACSGSGSWEQGWIIVNGADVIAHQSAAPNGYRITAADGASTLQFRPTGAGSTSNTLTVCRNSPSAGIQERVITVNAAGRVTVRKTTTGSCS